MSPMMPVLWEASMAPAAAAESDCATYLFGSRPGLRGDDELAGRSLVRQLTRRQQPSHR